MRRWPLALALSSCFQPTNQEIVPFLLSSINYSANYENISFSEPSPLPCTFLPSQIYSLPHAGGPGSVWIPKELSCGGESDLLVILHGLNLHQHSSITLAGKHSLEKVAEDLITENKIFPLVLVEMTDKSGRLYLDDFHPANYLNVVQTFLQQKSIAVNQLGVMGFSGAHCQEEQGIHIFLQELRPSFIGMIDGTCQINYGQSVIDKSKLYSPTIALYTRLIFRGDQLSAQSILENKEQRFSCSFHRCSKHTEEPRFVYWLQNVGHEQILEPAFKHMLLTYFGKK